MCVCVRVRFWFCIYFFFCSRKDAVDLTDGRTQRVDRVRAVLYCGDAIDVSIYIGTGITDIYDPYIMRTYIYYIICFVERKEVSGPTRRL